MAIVQKTYRSGGYSSRIIGVESAAETASQNYDFDSFHYNHCKIIIDVTAGATGADLIDFDVQVKDDTSGKFITVLSAVQFAASGTQVLSIYPGAAVTANVSVNDFLTREFRIVTTKNNGTAITYSIGIELKD